MTGSGEGGLAARVAVNLLWCVPGQVGGSEEYLARQLLGVDAVDPDRRRADPTLFALAGYAATHRDLGERFPLVELPGGGNRRPARVVAEHTWLAARTRRGVPGGRFDVVHHGGGTAPLVGSRPIVLTIHDLQYLQHPEFVAAAKLRYLRFMVPRSVRRAAVVTVPSEFVRGTVIEAFGGDPDRVVVVPHGVEVPTTGRGGAADADGLRDRFGLGGGPVLVYPAITHPHKNHRLLLEALARHWADPDLRLVLLGGRGVADAAVERAIGDLGVGGRVVRPGRVSDADRDGLLALADAMVFPSTYEGFGAPLIEAMALGTPVVCGDHPTLREVAGDAAVVLPADDPGAWAEVPDTVRARRAELIAAGRARVRRFDLAASGAALLEAYARAVIG